MRIAVSATLAGLLALAPIAPAGADWRVLLAFDEDGHRVHRATDTGEDGRLLSRPPPAIDPARAEAAGDAVLVWRDAAGETLLVEAAADPRVGHAPVREAEGGAIAAGEPVSLASGAWQARGPDGAATLELRLPVRDTPPLAAETWHFPLVAELPSGR